MELNRDANVGWDVQIGRADENEVLIVFDTGMLIPSPAPVPLGSSNRHGLLTDEKQAILMPLGMLSTCSTSFALPAEITSEQPSKSTTGSRTPPVTSLPRTLALTPRCSTTCPKSIPLSSPVQSSIRPCRTPTACYRVTVPTCTAHLPPTNTQYRAAAALSA